MISLPRSTELKFIFDNCVLVPIIPIIQVQFMWFAVIFELDCDLVELGSKAVCSFVSSAKIYR